MSKQTWKYAIKDWTSDDPEENRPQDFPNHLDAEDVARELGEERWRGDPCDPNGWDCVVTVKDEKGITKKFKVTAIPAVDFYAEELP